MFGYNVLSHSPENARFSSRKSKFLFCFAFSIICMTQVHFAVAHIIDSYDFVHKVRFMCAWIVFDTSLVSSIYFCAICSCRMNLVKRFGPISPTYMAEPFGHMAIVCGFSKLPQWSMIFSVRGSIVKPRIGINGDVGPFMAYTKSPETNRIHIRCHSKTTNNCTFQTYHTMRHRKHGLSLAPG